MSTLLDEAYRLGEGLSDPLQLTRQALAAAASSEHVFTALCEERALRQAEASMARRLRGQPLSPFDGIPYAVKDLVDIANMPTSAGSKLWACKPLASGDAPVIAALSSLGMIPIGKTNLSEFAYSGLGLNPHFGTPVADFSIHEPRAPGGSSSGSAIAVQRGIVSVALGTDTAGSVRIPAAFNGLVGYRASCARYPLSGVRALAQTLDTLGPIANTVADCVAFDGALRGILTTAPIPLGLTGVHFVVEETILLDPLLQPAVRDNLLSRMECLRAAGAVVETRPLESVARTRQLIAEQGWLGAVEAWRNYGASVEGPYSAQIDPRVRQRLLASAAIGEREALLRQGREQLMAELAHELGNCVLVMPTVWHVAPPLAALEQDDAHFALTNLQTLNLTMIGSLLDMPGVAIPTGSDAQRLPTSMLLSMSQGRDDTLLSICLAVENACGSISTD
ncbi:amidase family protein [Pseudomonas sp.]|uniref:amidase family protein n=1 Tax=Pseudomonas sp. TaxID=306 RepID=UPI00260E8A4C|nr:amidase family protein [Pseudomonas sp.]